MEALTYHSLHYAVTKCRSDYDYHVIVVTKDTKQRDAIFKDLCSMAHMQHNHYFNCIEYSTGSSIRVIAATPSNTRGRRADLVLLDPELYQEDMLPVFKAMEAKNINFRLSSEGE